MALVLVCHRVLSLDVCGVDVPPCTGSKNWYWQMVWEPWKMLRECGVELVSHPGGVAIPASTCSCSHLMLEKLGYALASKLMSLFMLMWYLFFLDICQKLAADVKQREWLVACCTHKVHVYVILYKSIFQVWQQPSV